MRKNIYAVIGVLFFIFCAFIIHISTVSAASIAPGSTLDPSCGPNDPGCDVSPVPNSPTNVSAGATAGGIMYSQNSSTWSILPVGLSGNILTVGVTGALVWNTPGAVLPLNNGHIFVGNASNSPTDVAVSGDASLSSTGVLSLITTGVTAASYGSATDIPIFTVDSQGRLTSAATTPASGISISGDVSGTLGSVTVDKLKNVAISISGLSTNNLLQYDGTNWKNITPDSILGNVVPTSRTVNGHALTSNISVLPSDILGNLSGVVVGDGTGNYFTAVIGADIQAFNEKLASLSRVINPTSDSFIKIDTLGNVFTDANTYLTSLNGALLTNGTIVGATAQAQAFTNGLITGKVYPSADTTTSFQINKADGISTVLNIDTLNGWVGFGNTTPDQAVTLPDGGAIDSLGALTVNSHGLYPINIDSGTTGDVNIGTGSSGGKTINLGTGSGGNTINIATDDTAIDSINIGSDKDNLTFRSGAFTLDGAVDSAISIGPSTTSGSISIGGTAQTGVINIGPGSGTQTINMGTGSPGSKTIHIGDGSASNMLILGSTTGTSSLNLQSGSGGITASSNATTGVGEALNHNSITSGNAVVISTNSVTTGSALQITSSYASGNSTNGLLYVQNNSTNTSGIIARISANRASGAGLSVLANGNVGIGTSTPSVGLQVASSTIRLNDNQEKAPTRINTGEIGIGAIGSGGNNGRIWIRAGSTATNFYFQSASTGDFSEFFKSTDQTLSPGELVSMDGSNMTSDNYVSRTQRSGDSNVMGVVRDPNEGTAYNNDDNGMRQFDNNYKNISIVGQSPVKVTNQNGMIKRGDKLTSSDKPGYAMKALANRKIIGFALEDQTEVDQIIDCYINVGLNIQDAPFQSVNLNTLNQLVLSGTLIIDGHVSLGSDTVGEAVISSGNTSVNVSFTTPYTEKPIVTVTPSETVLFKVTNKSAKGFTISISQPQTTDVTFDWHAFAEKGSIFSFPPAPDNQPQSIPDAPSPTSTTSPSNSSPITDISSTTSDSNSGI